jgi:SAM-dependent methyltransferase
MLIPSESNTPYPYVTPHSRLPAVLFTAITSPKLLITDFQAFRHAAFAKLWLIVGKNCAQDIPEGFDSIVGTVSGSILDVGPGAGDQVFRFSHPENITAVYGVEPAVDMHGALAENIKKAGLGGKYKILTCGAEPESLVPALAKEGVLGKENSMGRGVFDEVVCIRVLCGVPKLEETINGLYGCLKPGGRIVLCEHVVNDYQKEGSIVGRALQQFYMALGWSFWAGGCELTRDTPGLLMKAAKQDGGWAEIKLKTVDEWSTIPHIFGYCVKKS